TVTTGTSASVTVAVDNSTGGGVAPYTYQWQESAVSDKSGTSSVNYADISGATTQTYTRALSGRKFLRCKITDSASTPANAYTNDVVGAPWIAPTYPTLFIGDSYLLHNNPTP